MTRINILHLTDLHYGLAEQRELFPHVRKTFFDDLKKLKSRCGPWDLVLFSGDLVQKGTAEEFLQLDLLLEDLWKHLRGLNGPGVPDPILLAVPGNHDLLRPPASPSVHVLKNLAADVESAGIWTELLEDPKSTYRKVVETAFAEYSTWWKRSSYRGEGRPDFTIEPGPLPGDFLASFRKGPVVLGIVGLNTATLQLTGGDYKGRLMIRAQQFHGNQPGGGDQWIESLHACVLMTHHPPSWLAQGNFQTVFQELVDVPGRFVAHYCGHLHVARGESYSIGWSEQRRRIDGGSLFSLEKSYADAETKLDRIHAYSSSQLDFPADGNTGTICLWPRIAIKRTSGSVAFASDQKFELPDDNRTAEQTFPLLKAIQGTESDRRASSATPLKPEPLPPPRPELGSPPRLDPAALFNHHFVGREDLLRDYEDALGGLLGRAAGQSSGRRAAEVQLMWFHGFGGMGKSWFLRRACTMAASCTVPPHVALIDWHLPDWHKPAGRPPRDPVELFDAIAHRVGQLYGAELLDNYWVARAKVQSVSASRAEMYDQFEDAILYLRETAESGQHGNGTLSHPHAAFAGLDGKSGHIVKQRRALERLLHQCGVNMDPKDLSQKLEDLRLHQHRYDLADADLCGDIFVKWAQDVAGRDKLELVEPCRSLCSILQADLGRLLRIRPLVLVLDTCEVLPPAIDSWLCRLLAGLLVHHPALLVLIGSRLPPDPGRIPGSRNGWRSEVEAARFRIVPFDENVRFTVDQIAAALAKENSTVGDCNRVAETLHRLTLGVPLALGTLLEMHRGGNPILQDLGEFEASFNRSLEGTNALSHVIEVVANRFLLHLADRAERTKDLNDIMTLALLRAVDLPLLGQMWQTDWPIERLRELAQRYALLADGDLHPTVREFLRSYWRSHPPVQLPQLAARLLEAFAQLSRPASERDESRPEWILKELNLRAWQEREKIFPKIVRTFPVFVANNWRQTELLRLAKELTFADRESRTQRDKLVEHAHHSFLGISIDTVAWLDRQVSKDWMREERGCLDLVAGVAFSRANQHDEAIRRIEAGFKELETSVPRGGSFTEAYLKSVVAVTSSRGDVALAERALTWVESMSSIKPATWNHEYYWLLHNSRRFESAESYCRRIVADDSSNLQARAYLGHIIGVHLDRPNEAEQEFRAGLEIDPDDPTLHYFLGDLLSDQLGRPEEAETEYRQALTTVSGQDRARILQTLAGLCTSLGRREEAAPMYEETIKLMGDEADSSALNGAAWSFYLGGFKLERAEEWAQAAVEKDHDDLNILQTLAAIQVRRDRWASAKPNLRRWLANEEANEFRDSWKDYHLTFRDALKHSRGLALADLVAAARNDHPQWRVLAIALRAASGATDAYAGVPAALKPAVEQVIGDMNGGRVTHAFPEVPA
jgi:tetratricopeptide (TPR) repeat protein